MVAERTDFFPQFGFLPSLTEDEVSRWVALGREGSRRARTGDADGAEAAYREQIRLYPVSPDPYVALSLLAAGRGRDKDALDLLHQAVVRGFYDLQRISRAEVAVKMRKSMAMLALEDAIPKLQEAEEAWAGWDSFRMDLPPRDLTEVLKVHGELHERIALLAPALGDRQTRLWKRLIDRVTATQLETYVAGKPEAADLDAALSRLMAIYADGSVFRWSVPPPATAGRMKKISATVLARGDDSPLRAGGLACRALALNAERDEKGALKSDAGSGIRASLQELLAKSSGSRFSGFAAEGLVRTEMELGAMDRAAETYRSFRDAHASDTALLAEVRDRLGTLALWAGGLPAFHATALDGAVVAPDSLKGKYAIVDFWATWCRPCVDGLPTLKKIAAKNPDKVAVVGISLDLADDMSAEALKSWIGEHGVVGRHVQDGKGWDSSLVHDFGVHEIPFNVVVGPDGKVLAVNQHGRDLEKLVASAIGGAAGR